MYDKGMAAAQREKLVSPAIVVEGSLKSSQKTSKPHGSWRWLVKGKTGKAIKKRKVEVRGEQGREDSK